MKVVQINATCGAGSTGKICVAISRLLNQNGIENVILYSQGKSDYPQGIKYGSEPDAKIQALGTRVFGNYGFDAKKTTKRLLTELERIRPDIIHLHNLHAHNCNLELLFRYLKAGSAKLCWTFHDCWAFTGYCPHYDMLGCEQWKTGCRQCPDRRRYSWFLDRSSSLYRKKKALFSDLPLTVAVPSQWMADLVKQSFLKEYPVSVIPNGIDPEIFRPRPSRFREKVGIAANQYMLLGVASVWDDRKGLDVFLKLSERLNDGYRIVLVGLEKQQSRQLPPGIIPIGRTKDQTELAELYSAADLFVNPTREENYPTVNMEALACGTPVLTFDTGGSPEIPDQTCGSVVPKNDVNALEKEIIRVCGSRPYSKEACLKRAKEFDQTERFQKYMELYQEIAYGRITKSGI